MHGSGHHLTALERAEALCQTRDVQLTPLRRDVLRLVLEAEAPIGAYALLDQLKASRAKAAPPTVYRALDFLLENGLVHRLSSRNAYLACGHHHAANDPLVFLICDACGSVSERTSPSLGHDLDEIASETGFSRRGQVVELTGLCAGCGAA